jgi:transcriptional regulator with GAF, ATPase, and Fis domain
MMDKNEFFREATLRICGNLDIEKALYSLVKFLKDFMPIKRIYLQYFEEGLEAIRTIAYADEHGYKRLDQIADISRESVELNMNVPADKDAYLIINPNEFPVSRDMMKFHNQYGSSIIIIVLRTNKNILGYLILQSKEEEKFIEKDLELTRSLKDPLVVAMSNTLKHRNEIKLQSRDFFWEATKRILGNLEIETGLKDSINYLREYMPADGIYLQRYESDLNAMRIVAHATPESCELSDILIPLDEDAKAALSELAEKWKKGKMPPVIVINEPEDEPVTRCMLESLNEPLSSAMSLPLIIGDQVAGTLALLAEGKNRFTKEHAELYTTLKEPFFVAMSNTLKHREVIKLKDLLADDNKYLHGELRRLSGDEVIGGNFGLKDVMHKVHQVSALDSPVLLLGETGVGKDVIANVIHYSSSRSNSPFVSVNCGAIPDSLIDSELFGHEKGAFTGALAQKRGRFERANKGTIFLDEIGELPLQAQVRLLKVLQNREIERVGGVKTINLDIRIIAATNRNLEEMVRKGEFREDLWFRLNVFPIWIPPLRERKSDIPALLQHFISQKAKELKLSVIPHLDNNVIDYLMEYKWPGNVRELQNLVERALIINPHGPISIDDISIPFNKEKQKKIKEAENNYSDNLNEIVSKHIYKVLEKTKGKIHGPGGAAELMGINPSTLRNRMRKLKIKYE